MKIRIYRNWMHAWEPVREDWETYKHILRPLCVSGCIAFKSREGIIEFFADHGITAIEEGSTEYPDDAEQLMLF